MGSWSKGGKLMDWKEIKRVPSADGKKRLLIYKTAPGNLFSFEKHNYVTEDCRSYWIPTHTSSLYDSAEGAERDARLELHWLRDEISN
jgi:hypothetical protein